MRVVATVNCRRTVKAENKQPNGRRTQPLRAQQAEENKSKSAACSFGALPCYVLPLLGSLKRTSSMFTIANQTTCIGYLRLEQERHLTCQHIDVVLLSKRSVPILSTMHAAYLCWWSICCCLMRVFPLRRKRTPRDDWSTLTPSIVDVLAWTLKRTRRWKRDGPSLRLLNKHWCRQIDHNVTTVCPHASRVMCQQDVVSLLKFTNLTSVYLDAFLTDRPPPRGSLTGEESSLRATAEFHREYAELQRVIDVLAAHPSLSRLEMSSAFFTDAYRHLRAAAFGVWSALGGITAIRVRSTSDRYDWQDDRILDESERPLQGWLNENELADLCRFSKYFPSLRSIDICISCDRPPKQLTSLQRLESLKLRVQGTESFARLLSEWSSIQTLDFVASQSDFNIVPLHGLTGLRSVTLHVTDEALLSHPAFFEVLQQLEALDLSVARPAHRLVIPDSFFFEATSLEALALRHFHFAGWHLMPLLVQLKTLVLVSCSVQSGSAFSFRPNRLHSLTLTDMLSSHPAYFPFTRAVFPTVRVLTLDTVQDDRAMKAIATLTSLEVLCIENVSNVTIKGMQELEHLGRLRVLKTYGWALGDKGIQLLHQHFLTKLERFHFSGIPRTRGVQRRLEKLQKAAPQLILSSDT